MQIKIFYIHQEGSITGSAISLRNLLAHLDRDRFAPQVLMGNEGPARFLFEEMDVPVDVLHIFPFWTAPGSYWYKLGFFMNFLALLPNRALQRYIKSFDPHIVHINDKSMLSAGFEAAKAKKKIIWHIRSSYYPSHSKLQARLSNSIIRKKANHLIAISEDEIDGFADLENLEIIFNSVDFNQIEEALQKRSQIRQEFGLKQGQIAVGQVSTTIGSVRGTWDFIESAGFAHHLLPESDLRFFIVAKLPSGEHGYGASQPLARNLETNPTEELAWNLAKEARISDRLTLTGFRKDALAVMAAMDIIVVCNRHGVLGRMPLEAMALGRPLVVTAGHSGKSGIVQDNITAVIAEAASPRSIGNAIVKLVNDEKLRSELSINGLNFAHQEFDAKINAQKVMDIYQEMLENNLLRTRKV